MARIDHLLAQVVARWLVITDQPLLLAQLQTQQLQFDERRHPAAWVQALLKAGASQIDELERWGLARTPEAMSQSLPAIRLAIDDEFYTLSCAHYERYFQRSPLMPNDRQIFQSRS